MVLKDVRRGIELCLANGKRLFDAADALEKTKRYSTSIPLYILAYEEFGKARFLRARLILGEQVEEKEFEKLTNSRSAHTMKILYAPLEFHEMLIRHSPEQIAAYKRYAARLNLPATRLDTPKAIEASSNTMRIFGRLHNLKMAMLYVGHTSDWLSPKRFHERRLEQVCYYLRHEVILSYHVVKFDLFQYDEAINADASNLTDEQREKVVANEDRKAWCALDAIFRTSRFVTSVSMTLSIFLDSL